MQSKILISASVLATDLANINHEINLLSRAGINMFHLDVMDGHFVPNISFGAPVIQKIIKHQSATLDVHLMIENPEFAIKQYVDAGADIITIHAESCKHLDRALQIIKDAGCRAGIALNPATPLSFIEHILDKIDILLIMSVNPGYGGQTFLKSQLDKIKQAKKKIVGRNIELSVDGGVNETNSKILIELGVDILVMGSFLTNNLDNKIEAEKIAIYKSRIKSCIG